jgi:aminopeptidase N
MNWWDDLWLNESFAAFISQFAISQVNNSLLNPFQTTAAIYFRDYKQFGYEDDERNSATHPINGPVSDTDVAASIFDGITYNKGAAVLKQLMFVVGQANFSSALKSYFARFAWSNATIADFIQDFRPYFPTQATTIDAWVTTWL